ILLKSPSSLRSYNMNDSIIQSSVNLLGSYANPSWITSLDNTKITGLGTLATLTPGTGVATALGINVGTSGSFIINGGAGGTPTSMTGTNITGIPESGVTNLTTDLAGKQATLVSGTNIKTINSTSLLGSGDITISGGGTTTNPLTVDNSSLQL